MTVPIGAYFREMQRLAVATEATDGRGGSLGLEEAIAWTVDAARTTHARGNKLMVIGNGGSAAIASHLATDYTKNGGIRTQAFNDGSMLTCLGNDLGYENVFAKQIAMFAQKQDLLIAISSSGKSPNILNGVAAARAAGCAVATFSGFQPQNPLRGLGDVNFYVASDQYGFVEILHLTLCHAILDLLMGWKPSEEQARRATAAARA
jgi:D-sedoheptulose 7-phosphate isomerase